MGTAFGRQQDSVRATASGSTVPELGAPSLSSPVEWEGRETKSSSGANSWGQEYAQWEETGYIAFAKPNKQHLEKWKKTSHLPKQLGQNPFLPPGTEHAEAEVFSHWKHGIVCELFPQSTNKQNPGSVLHSIVNHSWLSVFIFLHCKGILGPPPKQLVLSERFNLEWQDKVQRQTSKQFLFFYSKMPVCKS